MMMHGLANPKFMKSGMNLHIMLLCICEFHENWQREGHTFCMGINEIIIYACSEKP